MLRRTALALAKRLPLPLALRVAGIVSLRMRPLPRALALAREDLGLEGEALVRWCQRAAWGAMAERFLLHKLQASPRGEREVQALFDPVDWTPLERALAAARGVLIAGGHIGPLGITVHLLVRHQRDILIFTRANDVPPIGPANRLLVESEETRRVSLAIARRRLREGGVVFLAPDARFGIVEVHEAAGLSGSIGRGGAVLARASGAVTLPAAVVWQDHRLRLAFGEPISPAADLAPPAWEAAWIASYLAWLVGLLRGPAENVSLHWGLLGRHRMFNVLPPPRTTS